MIAEGFVCSLCCGETRKEELCSECGFYQAPTRNYNDVPAYTVVQMDEDFELASFGNSIEGAICAYDVANGESLRDREAIRIVELLIDKYHFQDQEMTEQNPLIVAGVHFVDKAIQEDLNNLSNEAIVRLLGVIRFVARRRTRIGREYMNIIHQYVGLRVGKGVRSLPEF